MKRNLVTLSKYCNIFNCIYFYDKYLERFPYDTIDLCGKPFELWQLMVIKRIWPVGNDIVWAEATLFLRVASSACLIDVIKRKAKVSLSLSLGSRCFICLTQKQTWQSIKKGGSACPCISWSTFQKCHNGKTFRPHSFFWLGVARAARGGAGGGGAGEAGEAFQLRVAPCRRCAHHMSSAGGSKVGGLGC